jgi:hypothetical protein
MIIDDSDGICGLCTYVVCRCGMDEDEEEEHDNDDDFLNIIGSK